MNAKQWRALSVRGTDIQGAIRRMGGSELVYLSCLELFLQDTTVPQLNKAVAVRAWDEAFTAAHALKGLAGNMGFVPLMHSTGQLVILIRGGRIKEIGDSLAEVNSNYRDITDAIRSSFLTSNMEDE